MNEKAVCQTDNEIRYQSLKGNFKGWVLCQYSGFALRFDSFQVGVLESLESSPGEAMKCVHDYVLNIPE
jgi:hypothetical protein